MVIPIILNVSSPRFTKNFQGAERRLQQILFLDQRSFQPNKHYRPQRIIPVLIFSQGVNQLLMSVTTYHLKTKTSQMLSQHHHVVPFRSWTETKNIMGSCDNLNLIVSSCFKIPGAPTISQVLSFQNKPHYTFTLNSPKPNTNDGCHRNCS